MLVLNTYRLDGAAERGRRVEFFYCKSEEVMDYPEYGLE